MAKKKNYVYIQPPNLPIIVWFVAFIIQRVSQLSILHPAANLIGFGAIFTWAWLEIFDGANNFRRGLGVGVMIFILATRLF